MKILQVGKFYHPSRGGIETLLRNLAEGLCRAGDEVTVVCSSDSPRPAHDWHGGVRVVRAGTLGTLLSQPLSPALTARILRYARDADVVHVHTPNPLAEVSTLLVPAHVPIVASWHSDIVRQSALMKVYGSLSRAFLRRVSSVVVATPHHIRYSDLLPEFAQKCRVIPYGLELPGPRAGIAPRTRSERFGEDYILFVGRLVGYKGVSVLVRALRELPHATVVIVGDGPLRQVLQTQAQTDGVADRVHFLGSVDDATLSELYENCGLLVLPSVSRAEAFGLVLLEAMARGRPVVSTRLDSGVTLVNEDGVTGRVVTPNDPHALAQAIASLLGAPDDRKRMGERARARFVERFSRDALVRDMRALYAEVLAASRARPQQTTAQEA